MEEEKKELSPFGERGGGGGGGEGWRGRERAKEKKARLELPPPGLSDGLDFCDAIGSRRAEITQQT
jgi:hypothetical protein